MRRVVVTGMGLRTALGHAVGPLFDALIAGESAVCAQPEWAAFKDFHSLLAAPVRHFDGREIPRKLRRSMGRVGQFAVAASTDAVAMAGVDADMLASGRVGVAIGSTLGSSGADADFWRHLVLNNTTHGVPSTYFLKVMAHTAAANVAMALNVRGEAVATNAACASGTRALGAALDRIRLGRADAMIAGGADELHVSATLTFDLMRGASRGFNDRPTQAPRPFDADRDGVVVGEGAGILLLEEREHALARGATVLAEVLGYGGTSDGVNMASPAPDGMVSAIRLALADAGVQPSHIDYANAHATGTPLGDAAEAEALLRVLGDDVPVSSLKGNLGHTLGACGAIEAAVCIEAMRRGVVPPTRNLRRPDVAGVFHARTALHRPVRTVLSTNFAFGGVNTAVVLGAP